MILLVVIVFVRVFVSVVIVVWVWIVLFDLLSIVGFEYLVSSGICWVILVVLILCVFMLLIWLSICSCVRVLFLIVRILFDEISLMLKCLVYLFYMLWFLCVKVMSCGLLWVCWKICDLFVD